MTPEDRYIVQLAHAFVSSKTAAPPSAAGLDAARLLEIMSRRAITAALGPVVFEYRDSEQLHPPLKAELRTLDQWGVQFWLELSRVSRALHNANIQFVLLKGPALALTVYPTPSRRPSSDIDILVATEDVESACDALKTIGQELDHSTISASLYKTHHFHWVLRSPTGPAIELHWMLSRPHDFFDYDPVAILSRAQVVEIGGVRVRVPSDLDQLLHAAGQAALGSFVDLRRALDCALLLKHGEIDEALLVELALRQRLASALWTLLWQQCQFTGVAVPMEIERPLRPGRFARRTLETLARLDGPPDNGTGSAQGPSFSWSMALCAPHLRAALRIIRRALFPDATQFLGYGGRRTEPPNLGRRAWNALKTGARLTLEFCRLWWRSLRQHSAG